MIDLDYHIIGTGSSGNAVRIENMMFDCGMPFKDMHDDLYKVDYLCITHRHSDHVKPSTYKEIRKEFPNITVFANADVAYVYDVDKIVGTTPVPIKKGRTLIPFDGMHDVPVTGYIIQIRGANVLYMTDTHTVDIPDKRMTFDWVFLESNFDERKIKELAKQYKKGRYDPYDQSFRHLSTQRCKEFYFLHRSCPEAKLIELHQSKRFY